jgi:hypothetical protein
MEKLTNQEKLKQMTIPALGKLRRTEHNLDNVRAFIEDLSTKRDKLFRDHKKLTETASRQAADFNENCATIRKPSAYAEMFNKVLKTNELTKDLHAQMIMRVEMPQKTINAWDLDAEKHKPAFVTPSNMGTAKYYMGLSPHYYAQHIIRINDTQKDENIFNFEPLNPYIFKIDKHEKDNAKIQAQHLLDPDFMTAYMPEKDLYFVNLGPDQVWTRLKNPQGNTPTETPQIAAVKDCLIGATMMMRSTNKKYAPNIVKPKPPKGHLAEDEIDAILGGQHMEWQPSKSDWGDCKITKKEMHMLFESILK